jgi:16S rRNA (cytosine1402-N4)-methyltransferase
VTDHQPVLSEEVLQALAVNPEGYYVDGTYGRGGHSAGIVAGLGAEGRLLAVDRDPAAIEAASQRFGAEPRFVIRQGSFADLGDLVADVFGGRKVDGVLLDLGVSSPQLDEAERGFSLTRDGPLDMRFDPSRGMSAAEWLLKVDEKDLADVLRQLGEERQARRIARAVVTSRQQRPLTRTGQLAELVASVVRTDKPGRHAATRTFQAIRIFINDELATLERGLDAALANLGPAGRLCVISFHSLEDRIVKRFMRRHSEPDPVYRGLPQIPRAAQPKLRRVGKAVRASAAEVAANPRSRSATLRTAECLTSA